MEHFGNPDSFLENPKLLQVQDKNEKLHEASAEDFGHDISAIIEFKRHQEPGKTLEGMSADFLTENGKLAAENDGLKIKERAVGGYASPKLRAQETVDLMLSNVGGDVTVINKTLESLKETTDINKRGDKQRLKNEFRIKTREELDALANFNKIMPLAKEWAKGKMDEGGKLDELSYVVQWYLDNPEICKENGVLTGHEAATEIAERAAVELGMTERFSNNSKVQLINVTHGPKIEPFLQEIIRFKNVEEIGGALKPGESMKFDVGIDKNKNKTVKLLFRDKEYPVDENQIKAMSAEYRDKNEWAKAIAEAKKEIDGLDSDEVTEKYIEAMAQSDILLEKMAKEEKVDKKDVERAERKQLALASLLKDMPKGKLTDVEIVKRVSERTREILG